MSIAFWIVLIIMMLIAILDVLLVIGCVIEERKYEAWVKRREEVECELNALEQEAVETVTH